MNLKTKKADTINNLSKTHDLEKIILPNCGKELVKFVPQGRLLNDKEKIQVLQSFPECFDRTDDFINKSEHYNLVTILLEGATEKAYLGLEEGLYAVPAKDIKFLTEKLLS